MRILAFDTSSEVCTIALMTDDQQIHEVSDDSVRKHTEILLPLVTGLCKDHDCPLDTVDAICFGCGPGAFTGVRLAVSVAQGLSFSLDCPAVGVSSLASVAHSALACAEKLDHGRVLVAMDARIDQVYSGMYRASSGEGVVLVGSEQVCDPDELEMTGVGSEWLAAGNGWPVYQPLRERLSRKTGSATPDVMYPSASSTLSIGLRKLQSGSNNESDLALPVYLRDKVVG